MTEAAIQTRYRVDGMDCAGCAAKIDTAVRRLPGVVDVTVSVTAAAMTVRHGADVDLAVVERKVTGLGYERRTPMALPRAAVATADHAIARPRTATIMAARLVAKRQRAADHCQRRRAGHRPTGSAG